MQLLKIHFHKTLFAPHFRNQGSKRFASLLFLYALIVLSFALPATASDVPTEVFTSGGTAISVDVFQAKGEGTHPSVIFLYGADGMAIIPWSYVAIGGWFASNGFNFYVVHYFDRTGTVFADPLSIIKYVGNWTQTVSDAAAWVASRPGSDPRRIGLMGMSLGSFVAISDAGHDPNISAMVEWFGGVVDKTVTKMPPTLILHGAKDPLVNVSSAYDFQAFLNKLGVPNEMHIYPNGGHGFALPDELDAVQRSVAFFNQYLGK